MSLIATMMVCALGAHSSPSSFNEAKREKMAAVVEEWAPSAGGRDRSGMSVAVAYRGQIVFNHAYGNANIELSTPAAPDTLFEIASISKQFTAAVIMRLAEADKLKLDDPAGKYVELPAAWADVRIKHLLNHSSGIRSFTEETVAFDEIAQRKQTFQRVLGLVTNKPLAFTPGSGFLYSNTNYLILAQIAEKADGKPFAEQLDAAVAAAGLHATRLCDPRTIVPNRARGYRELAGHLTNAPSMDLSVHLGASAVCTTSADLVAWSLALQNGKVVAPASYATMTTASSPDYGYGLQLGDFFGHRLVYHGGDTWGYTATLRNYGEGELVVAVLSNSEVGPVQLVAEQIARVFYGLELLPKPKDLPLDSAEAARYLGDYAFPRLTMRFKYLDGMLIEQAPNQPIEDYFDVYMNQGNGVFVLKNSMHYVKFLEADKGHASGMVMGDGKKWGPVNKYLGAVEGAK